MHLIVINYTYNGFHNKLIKISLITINVATYSHGTHYNSKYNNRYKNNITIQ